MNATSHYSLGILAGGRGLRWGGRDKGLISLEGKPLLARLLEPRPTLAGEILICTREHPRFYQHYGDRVLCETSAYHGPCAGIVALLDGARFSSLLILPVDLVGAAEQVVAVLEREWRESDRAIVLCNRDGRHSPCMRLARHALEPSAAYVDGGGKRLTGLLEATEARRITVSSEWLRDANWPETIRRQADA